MNIEENIDKKASLQSFLNENGVLISSMGTMLGFSGILGAVLQTATVNKIVPVWSVLIVYIFILMMMVGAMLIWSEIIFKFPPRVEPRLRFFKYILVISYILVVAFLSILYRNLSHFVLPIIIPLMVTMPLSHFLFRLKFISNGISFLKQKSPEKIYFVFALTIAVLLTGASFLLTNYLDGVLDKMSHIVVHLQ